MTNVDLSNLPHLDRTLTAMLSTVDPPVARVLDKALSGGEVSVEEGARLFDADGASLLAIMATADELRRQANGEIVTYVVNRNINFTNVCIKHCGFCAYSRDYRQEEGYFLPLNEIVRRAREAWDLGATELCIQAGLPPKMQGSLYIDLTRALKNALPDMHIHGFSPEEVLYGAVRSECSIEEYLRGLKDAGVGSLPGTSAEIFDQAVRDKIARGRITTVQWRDVVTTAHRIGIPTTSTIMFGHVETNAHRAAHIGIIRDIQKETGGITEFVPLSFVHQDAPMWSKQMMRDLRPGATGSEVVKMHAVARIMLHGWIHNIQCSWVKEGPKLAQVLLASGCNDVGGTLINESISTSAGASFGQLVPPRELRRWMRDLGRVPAERTTLYKIRRRFDAEPDTPEPLDLVTEDAAQRFGSYAQLITLDEFRYTGQRAPTLEGPTWTEVQAKRKPAADASREHIA
jgi:FO synthase subunit 2